MCIFALLSQFAYWRLTKPRCNLGFKNFGNLIWPIEVKIEYLELTHGILTVNSEFEILSDLDYQTGLLHPLVDHFEAYDPGGPKELN